MEREEVMRIAWSDFQGANLAHALDLYERYRNDPASVDEATRAVFDALPAPPKELTAGSASSTSSAIVAGVGLAAAVGAENYVEAIRRYGHLAAAIDPLGVRRTGDPVLEMNTHGVTEEDLRLLPASIVSGPAAQGAESLAAAVKNLRAIYCSTTGYDVEDVFNPREREWLRDAIESQRFRAPADPIDPETMLERLTKVEAFEGFLQRAFPGKTRFSIEGLDMLVPVLDELVCDAADDGLRRVLIGMAHRGRLNVMAHVLRKPYEQILSEFLEKPVDDEDIDGAEYTGDVKYHLGASRRVGGGEEVSMVVSMPPNPSHLEAINPVLEGMARAAGTDTRTGGGRFEAAVVLPVLVHGDAAFPGQGVVAETLNMHQLDGYTTGGTIHVIANNQIGFTTDPSETSSARDATGLARAFGLPIAHVNADDPEACVAAARLAMAYRREFKRDFVIDLVGYRRRGHNEGDEPAFTQPQMYERIGNHPSVRALWAKELESRGVVPAGDADARLKSAIDSLQARFNQVKSGDVDSAAPIGAPRETPADDLATAVPLETLRDLSRSLLETPEGFTVHPKIQRSRARRNDAWGSTDQASLDWAMAEELAFASILADGTPIRLTGEDVERGTFSQRHAVLHDAATGARHVPLQKLPQAKASFEVHNSPLSENAAVGFEYGYSVQAPRTLVIWEAQYGDFINGAQTVLDEFVLSGRIKWGQASSLVLLLPHGSEGQGPDHASARPERFLQLAADENLRLVNCTTAAQYFHILRRHALLLSVDAVPLVVLTPKSLLRHPRVSSRPIELAEGQWQPVIDDAERAASPKGVRRLILCSGKIGVELLTSPQRSEATDTAICRVEQLCPVPMTEIGRVIEQYSGLEEVVWAQEEPENMGAWTFVRPHIESLATNWRVSVVARPASASPAEGSASRHARAQERLIAQAFGREVHSHVG